MRGNEAVVVLERKLVGGEMADEDLDELITKAVSPEDYVSVDLHSPEPLSSLLQKFRWRRICRYTSLRN